MIPARQREGNGLHIDGLRLPIRFRKRVIKWSSVVFHDMAEKLAEAQRKERALVENARDVICSIDEHGNFAKVSAACTNDQIS